MVVVKRYCGRDTMIQTDDLFVYPTDCQLSGVTVKINGELDWGIVVSYENELWRALNLSLPMENFAGQSLADHFSPRRWFGKGTASFC